MLSMLKTFSRYPVGWSLVGFVVIALMVVLVLTDAQSVFAPGNEGASFADMSGWSQLSAEFISFDVLDDTSGWAMIRTERNGVEALRVLRTADSGATWMDVTPGRVFEPGTITSLSMTGAYFLDEQHAWVSPPPGSSGGSDIEVARTSDGGQSWSVTLIGVPHLPDPQNVYLQFLDKDHGWLLVGSSPGMGTMYKALFRTDDGGATWQLASLASPDERWSTVNSLPTNGFPTGLGFASPLDGWITELNHSDKRLDNYQLSHTTDGGQTWVSQKLEPPQDIKDDAYGNVYPPRFGPNGQHGVLPVVFGAGDSARLDLYHTDDGGATWQPTESVVTTGTFSVVDPGMGWVVGVDGETVWFTSDGGQQWTQRTPNVRLDNAQLDFVDEKVGWAVVESHLLETVDGGLTWNPVDARIATQEVTTQPLSVDLTGDARPETVEVQDVGVGDTGRMYRIVIGVPGSVRDEVKLPLVETPYGAPELRAQDFTGDGVPELLVQFGVGANNAVLEAYRFSGGQWVQVLHVEGAPQLAKLDSTNDWVALSTHCCPPVGWGYRWDSAEAAFVSVAPDMLKSVLLETGALSADGAEGWSFEPGPPQLVRLVSELVHEERPHTIPDSGATSDITHLKGQLAYVHNGALWLYRAVTGETTTVAEQASTPRWSPGGRWLAFLDESSGPGLMLLSAGDLTPIPLDLPGSVDTYEWSPDGTSLAVLLSGVDRDDQQQVVSEVVLVNPASRTDTPRVLVRSGNAIHDIDWSPTGSRLAYVQHQDGGGDVLQVISIDDAEHSGTPVRADVEDTDNANGIVLGPWSPDGERLAYWVTPMHSASLAADGLPLQVTATEPLEGKEAIVLETATVNPHWVHWLPGGKALMFVATSSRFLYDPHAITVADFSDVRAGVQLRELTDPDEVSAFDPVVGPRGHYVAYVKAGLLDPQTPNFKRDETLWSQGQTLSVTTLDSAESRQVTAPSPLGQISWSHDGGQLAFECGTGLCLEDLRYITRGELPYPTPVRRIVDDPALAQVYATITGLGNNQRLWDWWTPGK